MPRALVLATVVFLVPLPGSGQALSTLHITVVLADDVQGPTPVPRHALLVSDNPATALPRRILTRLDGTADVTLRPGTYTVESDTPVAFGGRAYRWTQMVEIEAGRDVTLELTAGNAEVETMTAAAAAAVRPPENDPAFLLPRWQDSVVAIWTPTARGSGFVIDARGLIATSQRVVVGATLVGVQFTPTVKSPARVLVVDHDRDVAILWVNPTFLGAVRPVSLECTSPTAPAVAEGQDIFTIGAPLRGPKDVTAGTVTRVSPRTILADFRLATGAAGGPVFSAGGGVVGITAVEDEADANAARRSGARVVRIDDACKALGSAEKKLAGAAPPDASPLPVEPARPLPMDALKDAVRSRTASLRSYQLSSSDFDITFITPVLNYGAQHGWGQAGRRDRGSDDGPLDVLGDFGTWSEYVAEVPPVLLVRVTPRLVEGFWTMVARGAARTQGVSLPPIKRFRPGLARMRAFCGDAEVTPIHPFTIEHLVSAETVVREGLYVYDPGAFGPHCGTVKMVFHSEKAPESGESRTVDPGVIQQVWQDFGPYRSGPSLHGGEGGQARRAVPEPAGALKSNHLRGPAGTFFHGRAATKRPISLDRAVGRAYL